MTLVTAIHFMMIECTLAVSWFTFLISQHGANAISHTVFEILIFLSHTT